MTIRAFLMKHLTESGLFPEEAEFVINGAAAHMDVMRERWEDGKEGYPPQFLITLIVTINREACDWIDANKPLHWARPMFAGVENDG